MGPAAEARTGAQAALAAAPLPIGISPKMAAPNETQNPRRAGAFTSLVTLADIGFGSGFRFANLGGRREIFVPLPQGADIIPTELVLTIDDMSAHEARRSLEVLVNDRSVSAVALDGRSTGRVIRIPLASAKARNGFLKLSFLYSGAATQDRCIDVRYVGDSLTIRPESAVEISVASTGALDVATIAALMPPDVAIVLSDRKLTPSDIAAALTVARSLTTSGRHVTFHRGGAAIAGLVKRDQAHWSRGLVVIGSFDDIGEQLDAPVTTVSGPFSGFGTVAGVSIAGMPALLISDVTAVRAGRLLGSPSLAATRGLAVAAVGEVAGPKLPVDRLSFDQLGLAPGLVEVFGRADLSLAINARALPSGTRMSRLLLDILVAPDEAGEKAVVSVFVNERLLGSTVAATGEPTRLDLTLLEGLVGTAANIRAVVQRRSAQGDCRYEPQGYPAQILGSSSIVLTQADVQLHDFSDLSVRWADGLEILIPESAAEQPAPVLGLLTGVLGALSPETAPITVKFHAADSAPAPGAPFIAVSTLPPLGTTPRVQFDRGRIAVVDRDARTLLELGGFTYGAVSQLVTDGKHPGLWIRPLAADGALPIPAELRLDRGDVAVFDKIGTSLAMSTERDTLVSIAYPDPVSWFTVAARFRPWIIGGLWLCGTVLFLLALQRIYRRRAGAAGS
jgi:hypothetical protein